MRSAVAELRQLVGTLTETVDTVVPQMRELTDYLTELRADFAGTGEGGFYLPRRTLDDPRYQTILPLLFSADGHANRLLVYGTGQVWGADGANRAAEIEQAVHDPGKEGPWPEPLCSSTASDRPPTTCAASWRRTSPSWPG
ncbi:hypothetical protein A5761_04365 [Mycolicibacterium setense]|uniref:MMPL family transporter n=1 Tax=Mycolicibacterium setense TaxID=431269 RepID=UPI0007EB9156|nr:hypothetical protein A5761_04365 [Mycolicibacterium setense]